MSNFTSPVKRRLPITQHRQGLSDQLETMSAISPTSTFVADHLRCPSEGVLTKIKAGVEGYVAKFTANSLHTLSYALACGMLNTISEGVAEHLGVAPDNTLVFVDHHTSPLVHHPCPDTAAKPDVGIMLQSYHKLIKKSSKPFPKKTRAQVPEEYRNHKRYLRLPWHLFDSVAELKPARDSAGPSQVGAYAGLLNQARPDKPGVYCLSLSPRQYRVLWSDPSGLYSSDDFQWDNLKPLVSYMVSLYNPPQHHIKIDNTLTFDSHRDVMLSPRWTVSFQGETYPDSRVIFVGSPWTRQSWIAVSGSADRLRIIKDQYQTVGRRYDEGALFDILQRDLPGNSAPGCVHVECHGTVTGIQTPIPATRRQRKRMVMTTFGEPLYHCRSVFDFLKVMYDVLEVHRWLLNVKGVLHRDISINNILLPLEPVETADIEDRPKFIDEILDSSRVRAPSRALLCDFDNGCIYTLQGRSQVRANVNATAEIAEGEDAEGEKHDDLRRAAAELKCRTGTPAFIARSVAAGEVLALRMSPPPMPSLNDPIKAVYESAHEYDTLRKYEDPEDICHGGVLMKRAEYLKIQNAIGNPWKDRFSHQPSHDVESVFWVIVAFLLRARPIEEQKEQKEDAQDVSEIHERAGYRGIVAERESKDEDEILGDVKDGGNEEDVDDEDGDDEEEARGTQHDGATDQKLDMIWKLLAEHTIEDASVDSRDGIFNLKATGWTSALHPKLSFLAPMLLSLSEQVQPEYSLVTPSPPDFHLHEAMQRVLLARIWSMKGTDPILLDQKLRAVTIKRYDVKVHTFEPYSFGSKRSRLDDEAPIATVAERGKKLKKG